MNPYTGQGGITETTVIQLFSFAVSLKDSLRAWILDSEPSTATSILQFTNLRMERKRSNLLSHTLLDTLRGIKVIDISGNVFPISIKSVRVAFDKTLAKSGIENSHFHDLRHTFATRLVQCGVDLYKAKELLGHKSITVTMSYAHHYPESLRASVEVLDGTCNFGHKMDTSRVAEH